MRWLKEWFWTKYYTRVYAELVMWTCDCRRQGCKGEYPHGLVRNKAYAVKWAVINKLGD